jgi:hypothetical protein
MRRTWWNRREWECAREYVIPPVPLRIIIVLFLALVSAADAQQIAVPRIDLMPNLPSPYLMRDWKSVARGYDSLVFDLHRTGTYLPLVTLTSSTVNYPAQQSFILETVVGTTAPTSGEAINCIPAIVGATLAGIDKSNQGGENWPLMAQEWYNKRPESDVYRNHPVDDSGDDWWYCTMPNVFFYQMNSLYPGTGEYAMQFRMVADRWLQSVKAMGGSATPWKVPLMDHRGWFLNTMTPYDNDVHEPEAAGAIAWLLYNAYAATDSASYREGAEWAMEFLSAYPTNPAYELQLSYGTYTAARMNAELGTSYDVEKLFNWCFTVGPLRSWGAMVGTWGGLDCSGLIGEVNGSNNYAFAMNSFEQVGTLVPLVRYDPRFARAVGKWVLNDANAARLFYSGYLGQNQQDNEAWAMQYDPGSVIAYEALRQSQNSNSPYGTGDAMSGGWGLTNLALYGSSHVGILAGIIDTTNVPMILRLDALKTDYYHASAYPTFLYFNPYGVAKSVQVDLGSGVHDLYDAVSKGFIATGQTGVVSVNILPDAAILLVIVPAGGTVSYRQEQMLVNGVVVDYHSAHVVADYPPRIKGFASSASILPLNGSTGVYCTAVDRDGDTLSYSWRADGGAIIGSGATVTWQAAPVPGDYKVTCTVTDGRGGADSAAAIVTVVSRLNNPPIIKKLRAVPRKLGLGAQAQLLCQAQDPDGDPMSFQWSATAGTIVAADTTAVWTAPSSAGDDTVTCVVSDGFGGTTSKTVTFEVRDLSQAPSGNLVAFYPFNGNANDASGNGYNGTGHNVTSVPDRAGNPNSAFSFNGTTSYIQVPNASGLNFQQAITVTFWMRIAVFYPTREQYPVSHGNWENRWKISISNGDLRWTIKTATGTKDLDSETPLSLDSTFMVTATYDGADVEVYLNGDLDAFSPYSGALQTTTVDLTIGQDLPNDQQYNFNGVLDDLRIYDFALSPAQVQGLFSGPTGVREGGDAAIPTDYFLDQNYPNPFNPSTQIRFAIPAGGRGERTILRVYDLLGREIAEILNSIVPPGIHEVRWNAAGVASGVYYCVLRSGPVMRVRKLLLVR